MVDRGFARFSGIVVALVLSAGSAPAAPSARLVYVRDPDAATCPDEQAVRAAVAARLGFDPFLAYARATMFAEATTTPHTSS